VSSRLVLGSAQWGMPYGIANRVGQPEPAEVERILGRASAAGIDTIDTARAYGASEELIGELLGGRRGWTIVTKLPPIFADGCSAETGRGRARRALDESRRALRREQLDTLLLHDPRDRDAQGGLLWEFLLEQRARGLVGRLGISARTLGDAEAVLGDPTVEVVQVAASLLNQRPIRSGYLTAARDRGKSLYIRSVYLQGVAYLRPEELPPHLEPLKDVLPVIERWARLHGLTVPETFLLFMRDWTTERLVIGLESASQLEENLRAWERRDLESQALGALAARIPQLPEMILNPAQWSRG
jgi:aryl-alcohol dehydrogenase-like predicted oxidoreductase